MKHSIKEELKMRKKVQGMEMASPKQHRELPTFSISEKDLKEVKDWEVGKNYSLIVEVEQIGKEKNSYMTNNKDEIVGRFQIKKISYRDNDKIKELKSRLKK